MIILTDLFEKFEKFIMAPMGKFKKKIKYDKQTVSVRQRFEYRIRSLEDKLTWKCTVRVRAEASRKIETVYMVTENKFRKK